jgi:hypothetical protein
MKRAMIVVLVAGLLAALGACGGSNEGSGGSGAGTTKTSSSSYHCCINDSAYQCPGQAAFDKCSGGGDPQACIDKCSPTDPACIDACFQGMGQGDPSDCEKVSQPVSTFCGGSGTGGSGTGGSGTGGSGPVDNTGTCSGSPCSSTEDCAQTYVWCNGATGHCFDIHASCEGNPCASEFDCPQGFTCDSTFNTCTAG